MPFTIQDEIPEIQDETYDIFVDDVGTYCVIRIREVTVDEVTGEPTAESATEYTLPFVAVNKRQGTAKAGKEGDAEKLNRTARGFIPHKAIILKGLSNPDTESWTVLLSDTEYSIDEAIQKPEEPFDPVIWFLKMVRLDARRPSLG